MATKPDQAPSGLERLRSGLARLLWAREGGVLSALAVLVLVGSFVAPGLWSPQNMLNVGQQVSQIGIMAVGMTFVIITAEIDLSVGSINGVATVYLSIPSFIVTLGTLSAFRGLTLLLTNGSPISLDAGQPNVRNFSL